MRATVILLLSVVGSSSLVGCWGPYIKPDVFEFPTPTGSGQITGVVVSDFYQGLHRQSSTQSVAVS